MPQTRIDRKPVALAATAPAAAQTAPSTVLATVPAQPVRIQTYEEILAEVQAKSMAVGGVLPGVVLAGSALPARPLYRQGWQPSYGPRSDLFPSADPQVLKAAREEAALSEAAGIDAAKQRGRPPRGPPELPTGVMVVEQKYVDFLIGPGGQSLAAVNYAAGVLVQLDQRSKMSGYTIVNIYGGQENVRNAKLAIEFKVSQWLPLPGRDQHAPRAVAPLQT